MIGLWTTPIVEHCRLLRKVARRIDKAAMHVLFKVDALASILERELVVLCERGVK
jgi:hypothetical protein